MLLPFTITAQDWGVAQGGNSMRNGLTTSIGPLVEIGEEPELYWSGGENAAYAGYPVIEGENLIVYRRFPSDSQQESWIINYNVYTGEELWRTQLPVDTHHNYSKVSAVRDGKVYANRAGGAAEPEFIYALDIENGDVIWVSDIKIGEHESESYAFAENGDIIAADLNHIVRVNHINGTTVWETSRGGSSSDANSTNIFGNKVYVWEQDSQGMFITVLDIENGSKLYSSELLAPPGFQQQCFIIGSDGVIYADIMRGAGGNHLYALEDDGTQFNLLWDYETGFATFGNFAEGADGSIYAVSPNDEIVRLDPTTGSVLNTSPVISDNNGFLNVFMAVAEDGILYLTVSDYPFTKLYIFTPELELLWGEEMNGLKGIALGDQVLVVNGNQTLIKAYKGQNPILGFSGQNDKTFTSIYPNPSDGVYNFSNSFENKNGHLEITSITGQIIYSSSVKSNIHRIDISNQEAGVYIVRYFMNNKYYFNKIIKN